MALTEAEKRRSKRLRDRKKNKKTGAERVADTQKRRARKKTLIKIASKIPLLGKYAVNKGKAKPRKKK